MTQAPDLSMPAVDTAAFPMHRHRAGVGCDGNAVSAGITGSDTGDGMQACLRVWQEVRDRDAGSWLALAQRPAAPGEAPAPHDAAHAGPAPWRRIAREVERALRLGADGATAPALVLLAAIGADRWGGGAAVLRLAHAACQLAARQGPSASTEAVAALYATLIAPRCGGLRQAAATLAGSCRTEGLGLTAGLGLVGTGLAAGMALDELLRHLDAASACAATDLANRGAGGRVHARADDAAIELAAIELATRTRLLRSLLDAAPPASSQAPQQPQPSQETRFGHWLTRLQAAWYAGDTSAACRAAGRAAQLDGPLTAPADLMVFHLTRPALGGGAGGRTGGAPGRGLRTGERAAAVPVPGPGQLPAVGRARPHRPAVPRLGRAGTGRRRAFHGQQGRQQGRQQGQGAPAGRWRPVDRARGPPAAGRHCPARGGGAQMAGGAPAGHRARAGLAVDDQPGRAPAARKSSKSSPTWW